MFLIHKPTAGLRPMPSDYWHTMTLVLRNGALCQQPATQRHGCDAARPLAARTSIAKGGAAHRGPVSQDRVEILRLAIRPTRRRARAESPRCAGRAPERGPRRRSFVELHGRRNDPIFLAVIVHVRHHIAVGSTCGSLSVSRGVARAPHTPGSSPRPLASG